MGVTDVKAAQHKHFSEKFSLQPIVVFVIQLMIHLLVGRKVIHTVYQITIFKL